MSEILVDQPSSAPTRKVLFGALAGVLTWSLSALLGTVFPGEIPPEIGSAIPVLAALGTSYMVRDRA
jgi:hypothetical protein